MAALFGFSALVAGLILLIAGGSWFPGASTVGLILVVVSGVAILLSILILVLVAMVAAKTPPTTRFRGR